MEGDVISDMDRQKEAYLEAQTARVLQTSTGNIILLGAALFIFIGAIDFFATPENFPRFMVYRFAIAGFLLLLYPINKYKQGKFYQYTIILVAAAFSAATIELMILRLGGHTSSYYAGLNLLIICAVVLIPFSLSVSLIASALIYAIYLVPIFMLDTIVDTRTFITHNGFMISTFIIAFTWRLLSHRSMLNELSLQYDLAQEKLKLEKYSTRLEDLIAEKTKELSISEQRYRALFDYANDGIAVLDRNGIMVNVNHRFCELHGFDREALLGSHFRLLEVENSPGEIDSRLKRILEGESIVYEAQHFRKDGGRTVLEVSARAIELGGVLHIQSFHRDITDKKRLQEQLLQSQKMESIGVLAGGIAHDFNNILTAILGHAEVLRRKSGTADEAALRRIKTIEDAARRAGQMVAKLLSFARKETLEMVPTNLNDVVKDTVELLERTMVNKNVKAVVELEEGLPAVSGDSIQLEQVITNLIVNAMDAMPGGGTVTLRTSLRDLKHDASHVHPLLAPGRYVSLSVSDTGAGIPDEIIGKIFDPFFTTKGPGKGTGLGLAMVYGIVKGHRGEIQVKSSTGVGATFEVFFPATDSPLQDSSENVGLDVAGREGVLVVDDETDILSFLKDTLESHGYRVHVADNPVYAQDLFIKIADEVELVITDIMMPLMSGTDLIRQFREIKPGIKIIAVSGIDAVAGAREGKDVDAFIKKPFEGIFLLSLVRKVLDEKSVSGGRGAIGEESS